MGDSKSKKMKNRKDFKFAIDIGSGLMEKQESQESKEEEESSETDSMEMGTVGTHRRRRTATPSEISLNKISVARFRGIMAHSSKEYDVEEIIGDLKDETGHIPLDQISLYTKKLQTVRALNVRDSLQLDDDELL